MTEEKQIEEMAKDLCHTETCEIKKIEKPCYHRCKAHIYATRAIDKGYRKSADVAREIFEVIDNIADNLMNSPYYSSGDAVYDLAELKKKFTEGGE